MEEDKTLGPEEAETLRRKLLPGIEKFVNSGVITAEIQVNTVNDSRKLLAANPKLLTRAPIGLIESVADGKVALSTANKKAKQTDEADNAQRTNKSNSKEQAQLKKLMEKMSSSSEETEDI